MSIASPKPPVIAAFFLSLAAGRTHSEMCLKGRSSSLKLWQICLKVPIFGRFSGVRLGRQVTVV